MIDPSAEIPIAAAVATLVPCSGPSKVAPVEGENRTAPTESLPTAIIPSAETALNPPNSPNGLATNPGAAYTAPESEPL